MRSLVQLKTEGALQARARRIAAGAWWGAVGLTLLITVLTWIVQPQVQVSARDAARRGVLRVHLPALPREGDTGR